MIILASASPRRKELLAKMGVDFKIVESCFDESIIALDITPCDYAMSCAGGKAKEVFGRIIKAGDISGKEHIVLGADTVVVACGKILGKPKDKADAENMLMSICGSEHTVITGICIIKGETIIKAYEKTVLFIDSLTKTEMDEYISTNSPFDKAGGYGLQDAIIKKKLRYIKGSFDNVVGLPTELLLQILSQMKTNKIKA